MQHQDFPNPSRDDLAKLRSPFSKAVFKMANRWRFRGSALLNPYSLLCSYANRVIDRSTGKAFSADELATDAASPVKQAIDAAGGSLETSTGGNGGSDAGKALIFDVDGGLSATKSVTEEITCDFRATGTGGTAVRGWAQGSDSVGGLFQTDQTDGAGLIGRSTAAGAKCFIARGDADHLTVAHDGTVTLSSASRDSLASTLMGTVVTTTPTSGANVTSTAYVDQTQHMTPAASQTFVTLALPSAANARVGQIVRYISTTEDIGNVTVATSGGAGTITPAFTNTTLTAFDILAYQCISTSGNGSWIRIQ